MIRNFLPFCSVLFILSCNSKSEKNLSKETIREWIIPQENNWRMLENTAPIDGSENLSLRDKMYYINLSDSEMGLTEVSLFNNIPAASTYKLVSIGESEIKIKTTQNKGSEVSDTKIHNYQTNNTFWMLPNKNDTSHWVYVEGEYHCDSCSSYWSNMKINDTTQQILVIIRNGYLLGSNRFTGKEVEFYQKNKGIYEIDKYGDETGKLILRYIFSDEGIEKLDKSMFPLSVVNQGELIHGNEVETSNINTNDTKNDVKENAIEVPNGLEYKGKFLDAIKYDDKNGTNYVIISEVKSGEYGKEGYSDVLFGCCFSGEGQNFKKLWEIQEASGIVSEIDYIKGSLKAVDIDNDGVFENIFLYQKSGDGASAIPLKLMLHSGAKKYPIRGEYCSEKEVCGDYSKMRVGDEFNTAPSGFKSYAVNYWNKISTTLIK